MATHNTIKSYNDYQRFLKSDKTALNIRCNNPIKSDNIMVLLTDPCWKFQKLLRKLEYWENCKKAKRRFSLCNYYIYMLRKKYQSMSISLGLTIPINVFDEGLAIVHYGSIVVSRHARIGKNCTIYSCVNIGGQGTAATIGDNCYLGPGAKIIADVEIGDNVKIGANSVVNKSFRDNNITIAGVPATIVKHEALA